MATWRGVRSGLANFLCARVLPAAFALALPLAGLECTLRTVGPVVPGMQIAQAYAEPHPVYGFARTPRSGGWIKTDEFMSRVDVNALGLRERDIPYDKPAGTQRIVVTGDSCVEGAQVARRATATRSLENLLNADASEPVQVINAGMAGWGTAQEYLFLKHEGLQYAPDAAVVIFNTTNDVANNNHRASNGSSRRRPYFAVSEGGQLAQLPWQPRRRAEDGILEHVRREFVLFGAIDTGLLSGWRPRPAEDADEGDETVAMERRVTGYELPVYHEPAPPEWEEAWQVTELLLSAMRDEAAAGGVPLLVVNAPSIWEVYPEAWEAFQASRGLPATGWNFDSPNRRMAEIAERQGLWYLDLRPALRAATPSSPPLYFQQDRHWTEAGHEVAARAMAERMGTLNRSGTPR